MASVVALEGKPGITQFTHVRFLSSVTTFVFNQTQTAGEMSPTDVTLVRLDAEMDPLMFLQRVFLGKVTPTHMTGVGSGTRVSLFMAFEVSRASEASVTDTADIRSPAGVDPRVSDQILIGGEIGTTRLALILPRLGMNSHVTSKQKRHVKRGSTQLTDIVFGSGVDRYHMLL